MADQPSLSGLKEFHQRQAEVLKSALSAALVPLPRPSAAVGPPIGDAATLAREEQVALTHLAALASADATFTVVAASILAQRYATVRIASGRSPTTEASPTAAPTAKSRSAASWLEATRAANYAMQVVAAQAEPQVKARALASSTMLTALATEQSMAAEPAPPAPLGYRLPFAVSTPADAVKLASHVSARLRADYGAHLNEVAAGADASLLALIVRWLGEAEAEAIAWGSPATAFPGMT